MKNKTQELSRRVFGQRVAIFTLGAAITLILGPKLAAAQSKMTQAAAKYQDTPKGTQSCDGCSLFQMPNACKLVQGEISPQGWCTIYQPKT